MKKRCALLFIVFCSISMPSHSAEPKKLLVVTTTTGFRHSSIPTGEKILGQLAQQSHAFTVEYIQQTDGEPNQPAELKAGATPEEQKKFEIAQDAYLLAKAQWMENLEKELTKLSVKSLQSYDGVIFLSTTGDLPIPDKPGFLAWLRSGKAFIGIHSASDTFHGWPEYIDMLGGEFKTHGAQAGIECLNADPEHPATKHLGPAWKIDQEEVYQFKNYDLTRVHELLVLDQHPNDQTPGHYPIAWCHDYGKGRVFYTALGHREDIWDADLSLKDRKNPVEISHAFQTHLLGGILWALRTE